MTENSKTKAGSLFIIRPSLHLFDVKNSIVVIIDVLRATSTICTALYNGAAKVIPVATVEECVSIGRQLNAIYCQGKRR